MESEAQGVVCYCFEQFNTLATTFYLQTTVDLCVATQS
jgi:hypothetical protein